MKDLIKLLVVAFIISGCARFPYVSTVGERSQVISLCEVVENIENYNGSDVELRARYVSDGVQEEVLEDLSCGHGRRIIDIGRRGSSASVARFYAERKRICFERGASYVCNTAANVDVLGRIGVMAGGYVLDLKEVRAFEFEQDPAVSP